MVVVIALRLIADTKMSSLIGNGRVFISGACARILNHSTPPGKHLLRRSRQCLRQSLLPGYQICFGENRRLHGGRYGNLTLSRLPVRVCKNYHLTWRHRERRGCLRSDVVLPGRIVLHVFNVHLGTSFVERRHQARMVLSEEVLKHKEYTGPKIVVSMNGHVAWYLV